MIRTGDTVLHKPTGETWSVAFVRDDKLFWRGWPEGCAELSDCELVKSCSDEEHWQIVEEIAKSSSPGIRKAHCAWLLEERDKAN